MRILVDSGTYRLDNVGDIAMLQVALQRLHELWPGARLDVFTDDPDRLAAHCPAARPVPMKGSRQFHSWARGRYLLSRLHHAAPALETFLQTRMPALALRLMREKMRLRGIDVRSVDAFLEALHQADLLVAAGGGYITDSFAQHACDLLDTLALGQALHKPTALLGQGLGPIAEPALREKAAAVLPGIGLIALRERRAGPPLLAALGVDMDRVAVTGDDAIELASHWGAQDPGSGIGINLRLASYSEVDTAILQQVRAAVQEASRCYRAPLVPAPITHDPEGCDARTIRELMAGLDDASDGGESLVTPREVIREIGRCRVVVTGSYHAGVFALACGIPTVALARSTYYRDKFLGLADQFGTGCSVITLDGEDLFQHLRAEIDRAWESADEVRPLLVAAARAQIELGRAAYRRLDELAAGGRRSGSTAASPRNLFPVPSPEGRARSPLEQEPLTPDRVEGAR